MFGTYSCANCRKDFYLGSYVDCQNNSNFPRIGDISLSHCQSFCNEETGCVAFASYFGYVCNLYFGSSCSLTSDTNGANASIYIRVAAAPIAEPSGDPSAAPTAGPTSFYTIASFEISTSLFGITVAQFDSALQAVFIDSLASVTNLPKSSIAITNIAEIITRSRRLNHLDSFASRSIVGILSTSGGIVVDTQLTTVISDTDNTTATAFYSSTSAMVESSVASGTLVADLNSALGTNISATVTVGALSTELYTQTPTPAPVDFPTSPTPQGYLLVQVYNYSSCEGAAYKLQWFQISTCIAVGSGSATMVVNEVDVDAFSYSTYWYNDSACKNLSSIEPTAYTGVCSSNSISSVVSFVDVTPYGGGGSISGWVSSPVRCLIHVVFNLCAYGFCISGHFLHRIAICTITCCMAN